MLRGHQLAQDVVEKAKKSEKIGNKDKSYRDLSDIVYETEAFEWIKKTATIYPKIAQSRKKEKLLISY